MDIWSQAVLGEQLPQIKSRLDSLEERIKEVEESISSLMKTDDNLLSFILNVSKGLQEVNEEVNFMKRHF